MRWWWWGILACALVMGAAASTVAVLAAMPVPPHAPAATAAPVRDSRHVLLLADAWPPFNDRPGAAHEGYAVDLARTIFAAHGLEVAYQLSSWKTAVARARDGQADGVIGASPLDGAGLHFPQQEVARITQSFLVRAGDPWRWRGTASLAGRRLGAIAGYDYQGELNAYLAAHRDDPARVQFVSGDTALEQNLRKLLAGRIDIVLENQASLLWTARQLGAEPQVAFAGDIDEIAPMYVAFSPDERGRELSRWWDEGMVRLRANGGLARILADYGLRDWQAPATTASGGGHAR